MCMKYVNASIRCYKSATAVNGVVTAYESPFVKIKCIPEDDKIFIKDFYVVTAIDFLGTNNSEHYADNPLAQKGKYDFIIRITKCSADEDERIGYDLRTFSIDIDDMYLNNLVEKACFDYANVTKTVYVDSLELPGGTGRYVIKVLVKKAEDTRYSIQSMAPLFVEQFL